MSDNTHYDIAVIGAGVAGLSVAYFLSTDARVIVLERETQPGYHSSGRSAAMYIEGYENRVVRELTKLGAEFFFDPPSGFADYPILTPSGGLTAAGPNEDAALQKYLDAWQPLCPELVKISAAECRDLVPILRSDWVSAGAYDPSWYNIDVHALLTGYQRGIRANGGTLMTNAEALSLERQVAQWNLHTNDAEHTVVTADIVVNTAGAWANHVAALANLPPLPLTPMRRTAAIVPPPAACEGWPLVHTITEDLYFKPESPGLMICPQDETPSEAMDAYPVDLDVAIALDRFQQVAEHPVEHVTRSWAGLRTFAPDRYPAAGFAGPGSGFFWLAGQGGFGVQTSAGLGRHAADAILGRVPVMPQIEAGRFLT